MGKPQLMWCFVSCEWMAGGFFWFVGSRGSTEVLCKSRGHRGLRRNLRRHMRRHGIRSIVLEWDNDGAAELVSA